MVCVPFDDRVKTQPSFPPRDALVFNSAMTVSRVDTMALYWLVEQ
jgi:hypothetical protein